MALRKTGKRGQIYIPLSDGNAVSNAALTMSASKTIGGVSYTNRFYGTATRSMWNRGKPITVIQQGIIGEATITPASGNDTVQTVANISYFKDASSGVQTAAIDSSITVTRPASGKACWNLIVLDTDDGTISAVAGTDTTSGTTLVDTWDAAGGPPLVAVDKLIIGAVKLTSNTAAPVTAGEIAYLNGAGVLLQERADIPSYEIVPVQGGVLLSEAMQLCHTGGVSRKVYASYYDVAPVLSAVAHSTKWSVSGSNATVEMPAQGDVGSPTDVSGSPKWSGSFERYYVQDATMFKLAMNRRYGIVRLYPDRDENTAYYEGAVIISSWGMNSDQGSAMLEQISFAGDGILEPVGLN